ncbi:hypothetical protein CR513_59712, partial [Mucuna pruriens]
MDKESHNNHNHGNGSVRERDKSGGGDGPGSLLVRGGSDGMRQSTTSDLVLQWGNRKRLRCMKVQVKHDSSSNPVQRTTVRRVVRTEKDSSNIRPLPLPLPIPSVTNNNNNNSHNNQSNGYLNLLFVETWNGGSPSTCSSKVIFYKKALCGRWMRYQVLDLVRPILYFNTNSETSSAMRGGQSNGTVRGIASPDKGVHDKKGTHNNHLNDSNNKSVVSPDTAHDSKKGGGSPSDSGDATVPPVWPPKFVIALSNKEKEEDFLVLKGSKLPQRPKKRAKFIQRTLNLVSPGTWLCDLTLERYEVREKKITKKRPRGLKAMGNMESDSE